MQFSNNEKRVCNFLLVNITRILSRNVSETWWIIGRVLAVGRGCLAVFNALVRDEPVNSELQNLASRN